MQNGREPNTTEGDTFLQALVRVIDKGGASLGITLSVGGLLISGTLTSPGDYFQRVADELEAGAGENTLTAVLRRLAQAYESPEEGQSAPRILHLKDARVFHPAGTPIPHNRSTNWRIRLEAVDGFTIGTLGFSSNSAS